MSGHKTPDCLREQSWHTLIVSTTPESEQEHHYDSERSSVLGGVRGGVISIAEGRVAVHCLYDMKYFSGK